MIHQACRGCNSHELVQILDLGFAPPSNALLIEDDLNTGETYFPLKLLFCDACKLVQTRDFHSGETIFTENYPYLSSTSASWKRHSHKLVDSIIQDFNLNEASIVGEIASNDGYLLERLTERGIPNYGIEPTKIAANISKSKGHNVFNEFLNMDSASRIRSVMGAADLVIANNVFAHVPDLLEFTKAAKLLLKDEGILVIEVQYFIHLLEDCLFDTVYHEHYSYFTFTSINNLLKQHELQIFNAEQIETHGGSIRIYARNGSAPSILNENVAELIKQEKRTMNLNRLKTFQVFVDDAKKRLRQFFLEQQVNNKVVAGVGAAAKGNTLINFLGLGRDDIHCVFDSAESKHGKFLPGSHIPIYSMAALKDFPEIEVLVVLPWNIADELVSTISNMEVNHLAIYRLMPKIELIEN